MDEQQAEERAMGAIFAVVWIVVLAGVALGTTLAWWFGK
jgi:high-affinity Fe2+/Pb2+ permease